MPTVMETAATAAAVCPDVLHRTRVLRSAAALSAHHTRVAMNRVDVCVYISSALEMPSQIRNPFFSLICVHETSFYQS
jgi:hypothetical protein